MRKTRIAKQMLAIMMTAVMGFAVLAGCAAPQNPSGKNRSITLTIAETLPSCVSFEYRDGAPYCFYAYDGEGHLYRVLWNDFTGLNEKDVVVVDHNDVIKKLTYDEYPDGGYTPQYEITAISVKMGKRANDNLALHIQISSGNQTIFPFGCLLWSRIDKDGTFYETQIDKYDVIDLVSGKTPFSVEDIPELALDGKVSYSVQVNGIVEKVYLLTSGENGYTKSDTAFDALSGLVGGTYYVVFEVLLDGNCDPDAPQNSYRYEDVFRLVVGEQVGETHIGTSDEDYAKIQFFPQPIPEFTEEESYDTTEFAWTRLTDNDMDVLRHVYNDGKGWIDDSVVDRMMFFFDGRIRFAADDSFGWMYFGFEQNVLYYNGMFTEIDDNVMNIINRIR